MLTLFLIVALLTLSVLAGKDYYNLLGVSRDASEKELKKAFRKKSLQYHPDRNHEPDANDRFIEISNAYDVLKDPQKKQIYDLYGEEGLKQGNPTGSSGSQFRGSAGGFPEGFPGGFSGFNQGSSRTFFTSSGSGGAEEIFSQFFTGGFPFEEMFRDSDGFQGGRRPQKPSTPYQGEKLLKSLSQSNFDRRVKEKDNWFIHVYEPNHKSTSRLSSAMSKLSHSLSEYVKLGYIDATQNVNLLKKLGLGPNNVYLMRSGNHKRPEVYDEDFAVNAMYEFVVARMPHKVQTIGDLEWDKVLLGKSSSPIAVLFSSKQSVTPLYKAVSMSFGDKLRFIQINPESAHLTSLFGVTKKPQLFLIQSDGSIISYDQDITQTAIKSFISKHIPKRPLSLGIRRLSSKDFPNSPILLQSGLNLLIFHKSDPSSSLLSLQSEFEHDPINLRWIDTSKHSNEVWLSRFGVAKGETLFALFRAKSSKFVTLSCDLDTSELKQWISKALSGNLRFTKLKVQ